MTVQHPAPQPLSSKSLVSVIIPNYNHAQYLSAAIESVLAQDYQPIEIIVVDDGSTDNSRAVVAQFGDKVRPLWQENRGLSAARNTGIHAARGVYIGLLDADDMYEPHFVSTLVAQLEATPTASGIYCGYQFVDQNNRPLPQIEARSIGAEQLHQALADGNFLVPEAMLLRRTCYAQVGPFDEALRACEDWDMWLAVTKAHKVIGTNQILTRHRILSGSMSTDPGRMLHNRLAVLAKHFGSEPVDAASGNEAQRRAYSHGYLTSAVEHLQRDDTEGAYRCIQRMAQIEPARLHALDTFYELGCGAQPKGYRSHFASLDLEQNGAVLLNMMARLFDDLQPAALFVPHRRAAYSQAYFALGLLSYGAHKFGLARTYLLRALAQSPSFGLNRRFVTTLLRSLAGKTTMASLRQLRRATVGVR
ncbi:MAG: glycosyltransferase [Caldilineaceae bacterium]